MSCEKPTSDRDELHAEAFRDLEGDVCDLDRMGEIAQNLIMNCAGREDSLELVTFAVGQMAKMVKEFRANYEKRWHGELKGAS